jgi:hypothetical protein
VTERLARRIACEIPRTHNRSRHKLESLVQGSALFNFLATMIHKSCVKHRRMQGSAVWHAPPKIEVNEIQQITSPRFSKNYESGIDRVVGKWDLPIDGLPDLLKDHSVLPAVGLNEILAFHGTNAGTADKIK